MTDMLETVGLGKRYGRRWALSDCTLSVPAGRVVGLVGPNGAGKSTLLHLAVGLLTPSAGTIAVLGGRPGVGSSGARAGGLSRAEQPDVCPPDSGAASANGRLAQSWLG